MAAVMTAEMTAVARISAVITVSSFVAREL
jgi:hypothetical protein